MKQQLILLHGALGASSQLENLKAELSSTFAVHTFDFEGHGGRNSENNFSIDLFVDNVLEYMIHESINDSYFFGYSMGGYVALKLAAVHPEKVKGIFTYGTKFDWSPESAEKEVRMLNPAKIEEKIPHFAAALNSLHQPMDWKENMNKTAAMMLELGKSPTVNSSVLNKINIPVTIGIGDADQMVTIEESKKVSEQLPEGKLKIFENAVHPIEKSDVGLLSHSIKNAFSF